MSNQINKIVQADDPILNNLVETDQKMVDLNQKVNHILSDYNRPDVNSNAFFNFENPFFLVTLVGLLLLALGLWFLHNELKHPSPSKVKQQKSSKHFIKEERVHKVEESKQEEKKIEHKVEEPIHKASLAEPESRRAVKKKKIKIKVVKVK